MTDNPGPPLEVVSADGEQLKFANPKELELWLTSEAATWDALTKLPEPPTDPGNTIGTQSATEHAMEWVNLRDRLTNAISSANPNAIDSAVAPAVSRIQGAISARGLIPTASRLGTQILNLSANDPVAAKVAIGLETGRNITRLTNDNAKALWRVMARIRFGLTSENAADGEARILRSASAAEKSASKASAELQKIRDTLSTAGTEAGAAQRAFVEANEAVLLAAKKEGDAAIKAIRAEWDKEQEFYKSKLTFKNTSVYWSGQRLLNSVSAILWAVAVGFLVYYTLFHFIPDSVNELVRVRRDTAAIVLAAKGSSIWLVALPEIVKMGVMGFLLLWGLRFSARQVAENIFRTEDAALRKTMLDTYLALVYPREGKGPLVSDADRAIIIQALFRPSSASSVDDAPPSHWIEDVLARFRGKK